MVYVQASSRMNESVCVWHELVQYPCASMRRKQNKTNLKDIRIKRVILGKELEMS